MVIEYFVYFFSNRGLPLPKMYLKRPCTSSPKLLVSKVLSTKILSAAITASLMLNSLIVMSVLPVKSNMSLVQQQAFPPVDVETATSLGSSIEGYAASIEAMKSEYRTRPFRVISLHSVRYWPQSGLNPSLTTSRPLDVRSLSMPDCAELRID